MISKRKGIESALVSDRSGLIGQLVYLISFPALELSINAVWEKEVVRQNKASSYVNQIRELQNGPVPVKLSRQQNGEEHYLFSQRIEPWIFWFSGSCIITTLERNFALRLITGGEHCSHNIESHVNALAFRIQNIGRFRLLETESGFCKKNFYRKKIWKYIV
jgi:hypothetical protein